MSTQLPLDDDLSLTLPGDTRVFTVRKLRTLGYLEHELQVLCDYTPPELHTAEGRRHSAQDQLHLDVAHTHATAVLDALHSAGARAPGTSQQDEADLEQMERDAEEAPDPYAPGIAAMRVAAATELSTFEDKYKAQRMRELEATSVAIDSTPMLRTTEAGDIPAPPDSYAADLAKLRAKDAR
jgi:hypothetical protein